jgi:hypothetical protein
VMGRHVAGDARGGSAGAPERHGRSHRYQERLPCECHSFQSSGRAPAASLRVAVEAPIHRFIDCARPRARETVGIEGRDQQAMRSRRRHPQGVLDRADRPPSRAFGRSWRAAARPRGRGERGKKCAAAWAVHWTNVPRRPSGRRCTG